MQRRDDHTVILNAKERLGEMLVEDGRISPGQLQEALARKKETHQFIGQILVELGYVAEQDLAAFLVRQCKIPHLSLLDYEIRRELLELIPYEVCRQHKVLPVDRLGSILTVAMVDPFNNAALEEIRERTRLKVKPVLCNWYDFELVFARLFGERRTETKREPQAAQQPEARSQSKVEAKPAEVEEEAEDERQEIAPLEADIEEQEPRRVQEPDAKEVGVPIDQSVTAVRPAREAKAPALKDTENELPISGYTFDNFFVGQVNTFTYAIARAVAETPGAEYNPFFIYGGVGLGKTHLICAIGNEIIASRPEMRVIYTSATTFSNRLIEAIQRHDVVSFREHYAMRDVLIVDDTQFLAGRERAQEEFFDLFNALYEEHKQIIVASDKPPEELDALEKRLVSRFAGGIVAGVAAPEWETRMAILKYQQEMAGCDVPEEILSLVATRVTDDVRKLSGALRKIIAFCELLQQEITVELAQEVLDHLFERKRRERG